MNNCVHTGYCFAQARSYCKISLCPFRLRPLSRLPVVPAHHPDLIACLNQFVYYFAAQFSSAASNENSSHKTLPYICTKFPFRFRTGDERAIRNVTTQQPVCQADNSSTC